MRRNYKISTTNMSDKRLEKSLKDQRRMIVTLGISCLFTFFFDSIPRVLASSMRNNQEYNFNVYKIEAPAILNQFNKIHGIANFFIILMRHREFRKALKALLTCKTMPETLEMWTAASKSAPSRTG